MNLGWNASSQDELFSWGCLYLNGQIWVSVVDVVEGLEGSDISPGVFHIIGTSY